ncbi:hypothetical protein Moror_1381 [Moniliophthora roreri MCA 2997]|uniref:Uncharacterized protein n=1 Tax=Moniliophthora roreri (strain MCA 2997) TaxID=1381753 RepID=V2WMT0_MONRO|nr:hypothetical protein Moror_1381 [Moniliophthora roreri MCA 2997]
MIDEEDTDEVENRKGDDREPASGCDDLFEALDEMEKRAWIKQIDLRFQNLIEEGNPEAAKLATNVDALYKWASTLIRKADKGKTKAVTHPPNTIQPL